MVWTAAETVLSIFIMIAAGIFVSWKKWVTAETMKIFPKVIINIALPCMIIYFFSEKLERQQLLDAWLPLLIVFTTVPVSFFLGKLIAVIFRVPKTRRGIFAVMFPFSNSMFIGLPVAQALFGDSGIPFALFYYLANTTFFWTLGYYSIRKDADRINGTDCKVSFKEVIKKLITPPIITLIIMFAVVFSGLKLPGIIVTPAEYLNGLTIPLSLIFMGCLIYSFGIKTVRPEKGIIPVMLGRYIIAPGMLFAASAAAISLFGAQFQSIDMIMMRNVFTVQSGLPTMSQTSIVASHCGADAEFATKCFFWTTAVSLLTIPAYMLLFSIIG
jgi:predicted permease